MTSRPARSDGSIRIEPIRPRPGGFTLFEVLAAVLILGFFYTTLADGAIRGLRSEGMDRRRSEAGALADAQLVDLETLIAGGAPLAPISEETEVGEFRVLLELLPEDVEALLPPPAPAPEERDAENVPSLFTDESGNSRLYRLQVVVSWDEAGEPQELRRTSWDFDRSQLAAVFPSSEGEGDPGGDGGSGSGDSGSGDEEVSGASSPRAGKSFSGSSGREKGACANVQTIQDMMRCLAESRN